MLLPTLDVVDQWLACLEASHQAEDAGDYDLAIVFAAHAAQLETDPHNSTRREIAIDRDSLRKLVNNAKRMRAALAHICETDDKRIVELAEEAIHGV